MSWISTIKSASSASWRRSVKEVLIIAFISLIPLLCKASYYYIKLLNGKDAISFSDALIKYVVSGDLLFFSISNFAAVFWLSAQDFKDRFEERIYFVLASVIGLCTCTFFVGFNPTFDGIPIEIVRAASLLTFTISLIANVVLLVFENYSGLDFSTNMSKEEKSTTDRLIERKG